MHDLYSVLVLVQKRFGPTSTLLLVSMSKEPAISKVEAESSSERLSFPPGESLVLLGSICEKEIKSINNLKDKHNKVTYQLERWKWMQLAVMQDFH